MHEGPTVHTVHARRWQAERQTYGAVCGWRGPSPGLWSFVGSAVVDCPYCLARLAQEALAPGGADLQAVEDRAYRIAGGLLLAVIVACTSIAAYLWVLLWLVRK